MNRSEASTAAQECAVKRAAVLIYPGCAVGEVLELTTRLADAGVQVVYLRPDRSPEPIVDRSGLLIQAQAGLDEVAPDSLDLVVVPGGDPETVIDDEAVSLFLVSATDSGAVVAAICAGVLLVASSGLLEGHSATHNYRSPWAPIGVVKFVERFWHGVSVEPDPSVGVVVDGPLITALPNAAIEFAMTVCAEVGIYEAGQSQLIGRHLRGEYVPELYGDLLSDDPC